MFMCFEYVCVYRFDERRCLRDFLERLDLLRRDFPPFENNLGILDKRVFL